MRDAPFGQSPAVPEDARPRDLLLPGRGEAVPRRRGSRRTTFGEGGGPDGELEEYLDPRDSRQLLHITYGGLLDDPGIRAELSATLAAHEELHHSAVVLTPPVRCSMLENGERTGSSSTT